VVDGVERKTTNRNRVSRGFFAESAVEIEVDAGRAAEAFAVIASMPGWNVASPSFYLRPETAARVTLELRAEAIKDSRAAAEVLADAAGLEIVGVRFLGEEPVPVYDSGYEALSARPRAASMSEDMSSYEEINSVLEEIKPEKIFLKESFPVHYQVKQR
jgi:uncharacterized protein YggE